MSSNIEKKILKTISIYCFYGALREEQEVKRFLIGTTHKSLYKNKKIETRNRSHQGLAYALNKIDRKSVV